MHMGLPERYDSAILEAVDEGIMFLGESGRRTIYHHVERHYQIKREEIPAKIEGFNRALEDLFGAGSKIIGRLIVKNLYSRLGLALVEHQNWTLLDYVKDAKKTLESGGI